MNLFVRLARLGSLPAGRGDNVLRSPRAVLLAGVLLALCCLALSGSFVSAAPGETAPVIVAVEPTPDVHEPPIDDRAPVPTPEPEPDPIDDKAPPPSPEPSPSPEPIDDIIPAPEQGQVPVGRVEVMKAACAEGTNPELGLDDLLAACTDDGAGFIFHLLTEGQDLASDTVKHWNSDQGFASWDGVAIGNGTLLEELPAGYGAPVVYCQPILATGFEGPFELILDTADAAIEYSLGAGDIVSCIWFNFPDDSGNNQDGTLTIYKYLCDGDVYSAEACQPVNAEFMLASATGEGDPFLFAAGDDGVWSMGLPDGGFWELTELGAEPCWIASADFTEGGTLPTTGGHETVVEVFNCTETPGDDPGETPDDEDQPEITTLPDTGVGSGAAIGGNGGFGDEAAVAALILLAAALLGVRHGREVKSQ